MNMKKFYCSFLLGVLCILFLQPVSNLPGTDLQSRPLGLNCYNCYVCMRPYRSANGGWWPTFYYWEDVWIAGNEKKGTLYFYERPSPDEMELGPPLYIYESTGKPDPPEKAMFLPAGTYLVLIKGECFHAYKHTCRDDMYFYVDDGTGAQKMSAKLTTNKQKYGKKEITAVLQLQITDVDTGEYIKADTVFGSIQLPDGTQKTLKKETWEENWVWNDTEKWYEYTWAFTNDSEEFSDPKEGFYEAQVYVKKQYYQDIQAKTEFGVCYHVEIDLEFDKDIPEYSIVEPVEMIVHISDNTIPLENTTIFGTVNLPDGTEKDVTWTEYNPGVYTATYIPGQEGAYTVTVKAEKNARCYLEEASKTFYVRDCEKAIAYLDIGKSILDEPTQIVLTVLDEQGNSLSNGTIKSILYLTDGSTITLAWIDNNDGTYTAVYTPTELGEHFFSGFALISTDEDCFSVEFGGYFDAEWKKWPDLVILHDDIDIHPEPELGAVVTISVTVTNYGAIVAEDFFVLLLINGQVESVFHVDILEPEESITIEFTWEVLYSGGYIIQAIADPPEEML